MDLVKLYMLLVCLVRQPPMLRHRVEHLDIATEAKVQSRPENQECCGSFLSKVEAICCVES